MNMIHISDRAVLVSMNITSLDVQYGDDCGSCVLSNNAIILQNEIVQK